MRVLLSRDATAVPVLIERLSDFGTIWQGDKYLYICHIAAEALERIGTPEALEAVEMWRQNQSGRSGS